MGDNILKYKKVCKVTFLALYWCSRIWNNSISQ